MVPAAAWLHAGQRFENAPFIAKRRVIDVSGDGRTNDGPPAEIVRDKLVAMGIVINGLPLLTDMQQAYPAAGLDFRERRGHASAVQRKARGL